MGYILDLLGKTSIFLLFYLVNILISHFCCCLQFPLIINIGLYTWFTSGYWWNSFIIKYFQIQFGTCNSYWWKYPKIVDPTTFTQKNWLGFWGGCMLSSRGPKGSPSPLNELEGGERSKLNFYYIKYRHVTVVTEDILWPMWIQRNKNEFFDLTHTY